MDKTIKIWTKIKLQGNGKKEKAQEAWFPLSRIFIPEAR